ncbi:HlyD family type I secretion periplasmic adaptor subunit [Vibrio atypicus]|uniref:HlyD family type I secretion periplasmic adaptor subunit n=1 Tax=Vibrio atypicus TaxID=558271 RepID=UPI0013576515|nr:HlyD family type I secretion periplasmic adaptor subunit [Vibrio atypicus]
MTDICFHPEVLRNRPKHKAPFATSLIVVMIVSILIAIVISVYSEIEIISPTTGRIIPVGKANTVRSTSMGLVEQVRIEEGQQVLQGQVLVTLNTKQITADITSVSSELRDVQARIHALVPYRQLTAIKKPKEFSNLYQEIAYARYLKLNNDLEDLNEQMRELESENTVIDQQKKRLMKQLPLERKRLNANSKLKNSGYASEITYLDQEVKLAQLQSDISLSNAQSFALDIKRTNLEKDKQKIKDNFQLVLMEELRTLNLSKVDLEQRLAKLEEVRRNSLIKSPISGVVQELSAIDEGNYIEEGEVLLKVIPANAPPIAEIMIPSKDIGFIHVGQNARVKVDAFSYTRYGSLPAEVSYISQDAVMENEQLFYPAYLTLEETHFNIKGNDMHVQYGMSVKADIITGDRPLIDYFIAPIKENLDQALIER